ncbi:Protein Y37E11B.3 [Aphelenchoides avenae]|nr:Protein Y37E11B.3 [Aphelenchus avenae]
MSTELGTTEFGIPMQTGIPEAQLATDGSDSPAPEEAPPQVGGDDDPQRRHRTVVTQLEQRIRDITPMVSVEESPGRGRSASQELVPDPSVLVDLEAHARSIASNVDMVLRDLRGEFIAGKVA